MSQGFCLINHRQDTRIAVAINRAFATASVVFTETGGDKVQINFDLEELEDAVIRLQPQADPSAQRFSGTMLFMWALGGICIGLLSQLFF